jgi:hypothetical protein
MTDPFFEHLVEVNKVFAEQIRAADQKAAYVFTFLLAMLVWSSEARRAFSFGHYRELPPHGAIISAVLVTAIMTALISAVIAVLPRSANGGTILFFGAWPAAGKRLDEARAAVEPEFLYAEYRRNAETLAAIARTKYRIVRLSFFAILVTVIAYGLMLATSGPRL